MEMLGKPSHDNMCGFVTTVAYEKLKAENTELRYKVHILEGGNKGLKVLYDSVKANNDKLRELVKDYDRLFSSMHALCDCDFVPLNDAVLLALRSRMYELGIEVD